MNEPIIISGAACRIVALAIRASGSPELSPELHTRLLRSTEYSLNEKDTHRIDAAYMLELSASFANNRQGGLSRLCLVLANAGARITLLKP